MAIFHKLVYNNDYLIEVESKFSGYKLFQNITDKYTFAKFEDGIIIIDFDGPDIKFDDIKESLDEHPYTYTIVKSVGGFHVFITNSFYDVRSLRALEVMTGFKGSDAVFPFFTYIAGTAMIRMCKKQSEDPNEPIYKFVSHYVSPAAKSKNIWPKEKIQKVVMNHIEEAKNFSGIIVKDKENSKSFIISRKFQELENVKGSILDPKYKYAEKKYKISSEIKKGIENGMGLKGLNNLILKNDIIYNPMGLSFNYVPFTIKNQ